MMRSHSTTMSIAGGNTNSKMRGMQGLPNTALTFYHGMILALGNSKSRDQLFFSRKIKNYSALGLLNIDYPNLFNQCIESYTSIFKFSTETRSMVDDFQCQSSIMVDETPSLGSEFNDTYIFDKLNSSTMSKTNISHNIEGALDFIQAVSYEERVRIVSASCQEHRFSLFKDREIMNLLRMELIHNGHGDKYFTRTGQLFGDLSVFVAQLKQELSKKEFQTIEVCDAEIVAMLLFTMEQQDLYIDLKATMTRKSKKLASRNVSVSKHKIGHGSTILYEKWKKDY